MRSRLRLSDLGRQAVAGLTTRPGRSALTALGIAIGIAAIVAVVGISASGRAELLATLDRLGTNLVRVAPSQGLLGEPGKLNIDAAGMTSRIAPVQAVTEASLIDVAVRRTDQIPELETGGIGVMAVDESLPEVLGATISQGRFLDGLDDLPVAVLGPVAAERLGIPDLASERLLFIGGHWFSVIGIMDDLSLHPDLERSAMIGYGVAGDLFADEIPPTALFIRIVPSVVDDVVEVLPSTVNPENPDQVEITRPADALAAREAAETALTNLLVGLGAVALLVAGVAIANIQVMSVLERRMEIGVRRALGASKGQIRSQFLTEAILLGAIGGLGGVGLGAGITLGYAAAQQAQLALPLEAVGGAVGAALLIGAIAGLYPAGRAARISPAEAVRTG